MADLKRVILGLDGSSLAEAAIPWAEVFAIANQAAIVLVRAVPLGHHGSPIPIPPGVAHEDGGGEAGTEDNGPARRLIHEAEHYLGEVAGQLRDRGMLVEVAVVLGDPAKILVEEAKWRGAEMIVLSTHGRSGLGRLIRGSVADAVMREADTPVMLVPPACQFPRRANDRERGSGQTDQTVSTGQSGSLASIGNADAAVQPALTPS